MTPKSTVREHRWRDILDASVMDRVADADALNQQAIGLLAQPTSLLALRAGGLVAAVAAGVLRRGHRFFADRRPSAA
jgi:hypothetical protein